MAGDEDEPSKTPQALENEDEDEDEGPKLGALYVVSPTKLVLLHIATLGLYAPYWFYRPWSAQRRAYRLKIQPLARAVFSLFFVHALFRNIDRVARHAGWSPTWHPESQATLFIGLSLASGFLSKLVSESFFIALILPFVTLLPLAAAQRVANAASGDPRGKTNAGFDTGSVVVGALGVGLWLLLISASLET